MVESLQYTTGSGTFAITGACSVTANYQYQRVGSMVTLSVDIPSCTPSVQSLLSGNLATPLAGLLPPGSTVASTIFLGGYNSGADAIVARFSSAGLFQIGWMVSTETGVGGTNIGSFFTQFVTGLGAIGTTHATLVYHL